MTSKIGMKYETFIGQSSIAAKIEMLQNKKGYDLISILPHKYNSHFHNTSYLKRATI